MRIHRLSDRNVFSALNDWLPPETCMTAKVRPCVGRAPPSLSGSQTIWYFVTPECPGVPDRSRSDGTHRGASPLEIA
jgi:hypothetical protein